MALASDFQTTRGTALATFTQTGTYSAAVDLGGGWLVGCYSDNWPGGAGSFTVRASWNASGTGYPVQTVDGTVLRILSTGSGTFNSLGHAPWNTAPLQYVTLQVGTAGTAGIAAGGTVVLVTGI
jgi:hypothetical protein